MFSSNLMISTFRANWKTRANLHLITKDSVTVHTDVYGYDIFSLVVDLGSALGLWLGLSALTIVDYIIEAFTYIRSKYQRYELSIRP